MFSSLKNKKLIKLKLFLKFGIPQLTFKNIRILKFYLINLIDLGIFFVFILQYNYCNIIIKIKRVKLYEKLNGTSLKKIKYLKKE